MLIAAGICVVGAVVSQLMAPETTGRKLHETSSEKLRGVRPQIASAPSA
jgi:putative MFS transporter